MGTLKRAEDCPKLGWATGSWRRSLKCLQSINAKHMLRNTKSWEMIEEIQLADLLCLGTLHIAGQH